MTIAEASRKYGLTADTLRYYERVGIIPKVPRNKNGIRDYDEASCAWIDLTKCLRSAGVQIEALIQYSALVQQGDGTVPARRALLEEQRRLLLERRDNIQYSLGRLTRKIEHFDQMLLEKERKIGGGAR